MATTRTIRLLEHASIDPDSGTHGMSVSVLARTPEALAWAKRLPGTKRVFEVEGVATRAEAAAVLALSRQDQPDQARDPLGWGAIQALRNRVTEVTL